MKSHPLAAGRILVILLSFSLVALPVACARETTVARTGPARVLAVAASPSQVATRFGGDPGAAGGGSLWMAEALAGVVVVLGLSETLRRRGTRQHRNLELGPMRTQDS
jgi:hypothetical protein